MDNRAQQQNNCNHCSVSNLRKLKKNWLETQNEEDRIKYLETLKRCNAKLVDDNEI
ncbi:hypothetical protein [Thermincola potens]|uniref:Uncharacterized protein n=1 Tax=Thermincola potens (strain JR) TaxID=635013 RepID=D5XDZ0_THEPJ|nr:hypothetical protein [Thermincola potens]ADG81861.1 hypothetical protein TherJR_0996 [Thermincola potens JR]